MKLVGPYSQLHGGKFHLLYTCFEVQLVVKPL